MRSVLSACFLHGLGCRETCSACDSNWNAFAMHICYLPGGRSVWEKTVPEVLSTARGRRPRAVLKTKGTVFSHTDQPSPVNYIFIFFSGRLLFKVWKEIGIKDIAYVASRMLKKHQVKKTKENKVSMFQWLALFWRVSTQIHEKSQQVYFFPAVNWVCSRLRLVCLHNFFIESSGALSTNDL